mmetsp:Transcript_13658/g.47623  ORF Transcript_13658/g.47623 Transcript_13658/m.47623 type:complete len:603 (-) Transcript_13658:168-1976(-)
MLKSLERGEGGDGLRFDEWPSGDSSSSDSDEVDHDELGDTVGSLGRAVGAVRVSEGDELGFRVFVEVADEVFDIAAGSGDQTAKWLSLVAYTRYRAAKRSVANYSTNAFLGNKRPVCLTLDGVEVPPTTKLKELAPKLGCDERGVPLAGAKAKILVVEIQAKGSKKGQSLMGGAAQTTWEAMAFNHSAEGKRRASKLLDLATAATRKAKAEADALQAERDAIKASAFEKLLVVDLDDPESVARALSGDWQHVRVGLLTRSPEEEEEVKKLYLKHFVIISDVFKHFAGGSADGGTDEISALEFLQFALSLPGKICELARDANDIKKIFRASTTGRGEEDDNPDSLSRFEFMEALLRMALWKFGTPPGALRVAGRMNAYGALATLLEEYVLPGAKEVGVGNFREAMKDPGVRAAFARKMGVLRAVFDTYCRGDEEDLLSGGKAAGGAGGAGGSPMKRAATMKANRGLAPNAKTMNLDEFERVIRECGLQHSKDGAVLSSQDVRRIFSASQADDATSDGLSDSDSDESAGDSSQELVLGEFIDAVARLALLKFKGREDLEPSKMIELGIDALSTVAPSTALKRAATMRKATSIFAKRLSSMRTKK